MNIQERLALYVPVRLAADLRSLSDSEHRMLRLFVEAAQVMDELFWIQNYGDRKALLASVADPDERRFMELNYGPWDRLHHDEAAVAGFGSKPPGANFYPADVTREEFERAAAANPGLKSPYTMVRRDGRGSLVAIPYKTFFREQLQLAATRLRKAAELAKEPRLRAYLSLRAEALLTDEYRPSDFAWMDVNASNINILIGPMEIADRLFGLKTAYAASVFLKDWERSERLRRYEQLLSQFQQTLPVSDAYKGEPPGLDGDLGVYDAICYAGYDRAGPPLGIAWPADEEVQLRKGTRSLLVRNVMHANYKHILLPLADSLITNDQRQHVTFEANFNFILLHEVAHGLGIKQTITGKGLVKESLKEHDFAIEEGKADLLSLAMMSQLVQWGYMSEGDLRDAHVTSLARLLYNLGRHSIARLNFFKEVGAYSRDAGSGKYRIHMERMQPAVNSLAERLLRLQGDGDYDGAMAFLDHYGQPDEDLSRDIERLDADSLPQAIALPPLIE